MSEKVVFPYISERSWWILRDRFATRLPNEITISYLKSLLGFTTVKAARNLIPPLRRLGLIDDESKTTDRANDWRSDSKYAETCQQMLEEVYQQELRDLHAGEDIDRAALEEWFMQAAGVGKGTARQFAQMYILLNDATPRSSTELPAKRRARKAKRPEVSAVKETARPAAATARQRQAPTRLGTPVSPRPMLGDQLALHIDLQIHISPEASAEQIDEIFASVAKHLFPSQSHALGASNKIGDD